MLLPLTVKRTVPDGGTTLTTAVSVVGEPAAATGGLARYILTPVFVTWTVSGELRQVEPQVKFVDDGM